MTEAAKHTPSDADLLDALMMLAAACERMEPRMHHQPHALFQARDLIARTALAQARRKP